MSHEKYVIEITNAASPSVWVVTPPAAGYGTAVAATRIQVAPRERNLHRVFDGGGQDYICAEKIKYKLMSAYPSSARVDIRRVRYDSKTHTPYRVIAHVSEATLHARLDQICAQVG